MHIIVYINSVIKCIVNNSVWHNHSSSQKCLEFKNIFFDLSVENVIVSSSVTNSYYCSPITNGTDGTTKAMSQIFRGNMHTPGTSRAPQANEPPPKPGLSPSQNRLSPLGRKARYPIGSWRGNRARTVPTAVQFIRLGCAGQLHRWATAVGFPIAHTHTHARNDVHQNSSSYRVRFFSIEFLFGRPGLFGVPYRYPFGPLYTALTVPCYISVCSEFAVTVDRSVCFCYCRKYYSIVTDCPY